MADKFKKLDENTVEKTSDKVETFKIVELQQEKNRIIFKMDGLTKRMNEIDKALNAK